MKSEYDTYIETINEIEQVEEIVMKENKLKRCCISSLELLKVAIRYIKQCKQSKK